MEDTVAKSKQDQLNTGRWVLAAAILASSMAFIDSTALNVALPVLQKDLQASGGQLLWIVNAYLLMLAALILVGGSLGDRLGRKKVFMAGITLFLLGSLACGLSPSVEFIIAARVLQGIGGAVMIPGSLAIITTFFDAGQRGQAIGTWSAATTIVTVAGPVLGGFLANIGFWRGVFLINILIGVFALLLTYLHVPESRDELETGKIDYLGAFLAALALAGLAYGFISAPAYSFSDRRVYGALITGVAALLLFVLREARVENPMMPLKVFKSSTFSGANLLTLFLYAGLYGFSFFFSLNLVQVQGYNPSLAGFSFLPFSILLASLSRLAGSWADLHGPRWLLIIGPFLAGVGFLLMGFTGLTNGPQDYWRTFFPGVVALGLGMGITVAPLTTAVMNAVDTHLAGTASGINNAVARTAGVLAIAVLGSVALTVFSNALQSRSAEINLSEPARQELMAQAQNLGATHVPTQVQAENKTAVQQSIDLAFADTFQVIMFICTGLAWLSALMATLLIARKV